MNCQPYTTARIILLTLLVFALAGCGSNHRSGSSSKTVIAFWNGFTGPDGVTMTAMVQQFQKENPDIEVDMQLIPWGTYYDKLTLSLAYGGAPDVFIMQAARLPEYASFGEMKDLSANYASDPKPLTAGKFAAVPWKESFYNGVHVALPLDIHPMGMYYNTKLFKDAGIVDAHGNAKPPTNLTEFIADAKKLTKDTTGNGRIDQWGFVFTFQHTNWLTFAHQFGGDMVTPDGKSGAMSSPQSLAATNLMCDFIYKYKIAPRPEGVDAWLAMRQGKAAMAFEGIYMLNSLQTTPGLQFAGAPVPQFGPMKAVWGGSHLMCQPVGISPKQSKAAWRLMRFLSDHSLTWGIGGQIPARMDVQNTPQFKSLQVQSAFASEVPYVHYDPQITRANAINQFSDPAIEAALLQLQTPKDAMQDADRRIDQLLARP